MKEILDAQVVELLGRNRLTDELLKAGLEVAHPTRDRGIDLIAYADLDTGIGSFVARPIQMKAASGQVFGLDRKYEKFPGLILAYVWNLSEHSDEAVGTFALSYSDAHNVAQNMGWTGTQSWANGRYVSTRPGLALKSMLEPFRMTPARWRTLILRDMGTSAQQVGPVAQVAGKGQSDEHKLQD